MGKLFNKFFIAFIFLGFFSFIAYYQDILNFSVNLGSLEGQQATSRQPQPKQIQIKARQNSAEYEYSDYENVATVEATRFVSETVKYGDHISKVLRRIKLSEADIKAVANSPDVLAKLSTIFNADAVTAYIGDNNLLVGFDYSRKLDRIEYEFSRRGNSFIMTNENQPQIDWDRKYYYGVVTDSLYSTVKDLGLPPSIVIKLIEIYRWDVDFTQLGENDWFNILLEEKYLDTEHIGYGEIVYAKLSIGGKKLPAIRFENNLGKAEYYFPSGQSLRKEFLRYPLKMDEKDIKVSSKFGPRIHPIKNRSALHEGVDYAVPRGTMVLASGDGKILKIKKNSPTAGNYIVIKHKRGYVTRYLHLSGFASDIREGTVVKQGQLIGYVGQTGGVTGPHLHYEYRDLKKRSDSKVKGRAIDPTTVDFEHNHTIRYDKKARFHGVVGLLTKELHIDTRVINMASERFSRIK